MRDPLLLPLAALIAGIVAARHTRFDQSELLAAAAAFLLLAARPRLRWLCLLLTVVALGALIAERRRPGPPPVIEADPRETVVVEGCVVEPPAFAPDRERFLLELEPGARAAVSVYPRDGESLPRLRYGQRVEVTGRIRRPRSFRNPGSFDYAAYLARREIYWTMSASGAAAVRVLEGTCGSVWQSALFAIRTKALDRLAELYAGDPYGTAMMQAVLIGDTARMEAVWTEDFRRTGTYHALVISGLHIAVLAGCLLFLLRALPLRPELAWMLTTVVAWLYALVAGGTAPVVRAAGGFTLLALAHVWFRRPRVLNLLAAVAIAFLLADPHQLFDASFQLSFLAVAAIGAVATPLLEGTSGPLWRGLRRIDEPRRDLRFAPPVAQFRIELRLMAETFALLARGVPVRWVLVPAAGLLAVLFQAWNLLVVSSAVQAGLALPMALYFHRLSVTGLTANLIVSPAMSACVIAGFTALLTNWEWPARIAGLLLSLCRLVTHWHAAREPSWRVLDPPAWLALACGVTWLWLAWALRGSRWRRTAAAALAVMLALLIAHPFPPALPAGALELTAIDVGQGESLFVAFPNGSTMIVDGGGFPSRGRIRGSFDTGEDVVSPYLWTRSIRSVDVIALSHAHEDHLGGLPALIENFRPRQVWIGPVPAGPERTRIEAAVRRSGALLVEKRAGQSEARGGAQVRVLWPPAGHEPAGKPHNNDSLVLQLTYGEHSFLLMGDAERTVEAALAGDPALRATVLKAGHHGSRTSSTPAFLDAVRPAFAIISAGADNAFGHPHPAVLQALQQRHATALRTDRSGLVTVRSDGRRIQVEQPLCYASTRAGN